MRIHSDTITPADLYRVTADLDGVYVERAAAHGSHSRRGAVDFILSGTSNRKTNPGWSHGDRGFNAATWDEWGITIERLFQLDPDATFPQAYLSHSEFRQITGGRFDTLEHAEQHKNHRFEFVSPRHFECKCGAQRNGI